MEFMDFFSIFASYYAFAESKAQKKKIKITIYDI